MAGPVICLTSLSTVADLALAASAHTRLPTVGHTADEGLLLAHLLVLTGLGDVRVGDTDTGFDLQVLTVHNQSNYGRGGLYREFRDTE